MARKNRDDKQSNARPKKAAATKQTSHSPERPHQQNGIVVRLGKIKTTNKGESQH